GADRRWFSPARRRRVAVAAAAAAVRGRRHPGRALHLLVGSAAGAGRRVVATLVVVVIGRSRAARGWTLRAALLFLFLLGSQLQGARALARGAIGARRSQPRRRLRPRRQHHRERRGNGDDQEVREQTAGG